MQKYIKKVLEQADRIGKDGVWHVTVRHDNWCSIFKSGVCTCDPVVGRVKKRGKHADQG